MLNPVWLLVALAAGILWEVVKVRKTLEDCLEVLKQKKI